MTLFTKADIEQALRDGPAPLPGGYPRYFVCGDGEPLSFAAVQANLVLCLEATEQQDRSGWHIVGIDTNYENPALHCAHTGLRIESAYAEDDAKEPALA